MPVAYEDVAHLLRRAGFGAKQSTVSSLATLELSQIIDMLLDTTKAEPLNMGADITGTTDQWERMQRFVFWWVDRLATTQAPLVEKMVLFWHGHFCSAMEKASTNTMLEQFQLFRTYGLGNFETLTQKVSVGIAMLKYLDNDYSTKWSVNENFARELMELFTLGVNQYSQSDVYDIARAWTGHNVVDAGDYKFSYQFFPTKHDTNNKTIFGTTRNWDGPEVVTAICSGVKQSTTARFIAAKMWSYFAYTSPSSSLVDDLASAFVASNMNISALLRAIFMRPEFYSTQSKRGRVKNPIEYCASTQRILDSGRKDDIHPEWYLRSMGMYPWEPPNVSGWKLNAYWISASSAWAKARYTRYISWTAAKKGFLSGTSTVSVQTAVQRTFDAFEIANPTPSSRAALESMVTAERSARGWAEQVNLITAGLMTPEFQLA